jgi:hypothetical protein
MNPMLAYLEDYLSDRARRERDYHDSDAWGR